MTISRKKERTITQEKGSVIRKGDFHKKTPQGFQLEEVEYNLGGGLTQKGEDWGAMKRSSTRTAVTLPPADRGVEEMVKEKSKLVSGVGSETHGHRVGTSPIGGKETKESQPT